MQLTLAAIAAAMIVLFSLLSDENSISGLFSWGSMIVSTWLLAQIISIALLYCLVLEVQMEVQNQVSH
jgi:hypothetical protein